MAISNPNDALMQACQATTVDGGLKQAIEALKNGAKVDYKDAIGSTPLHEAAYNGHTETVRLLLQHKADVNAKTQFGWTPLHYATSYGNTETARLLLQHKAEINAKTKHDRTPLHLAASNGHTETARLFLQSPELRLAERTNEDGESALSFAAWENHQPLVTLLLQAGAYIDLSLAGNHQGQTPREVIERAGRAPESQAILKAAETLLEIAKNPPDKSANEAVIGFITTLGPALNARRVIDGKTALHLAILNSNDFLIRTLLSNGASVDIRNQKPDDKEKGQSVFELARSQDLSPEIRALIHNRKLEQVLAAKKAVLQSQAEYQKELAAHLGQVLNTQNINLLGFDKDTKTPLMYALSQGNLVAAKYLLEQSSINVLMSYDKEGTKEDAFNYFLRLVGNKVIQEARDNKPIPPFIENESPEITQERLAREVFKLLNDKAKKAAYRNSLEEEARESERLLAEVIKDFIEDKSFDENKRIFIREYIQEQIEKAKSQSRVARNSLSLDADSTSEEEIKVLEQLLQSPALLDKSQKPKTLMFKGLTEPAEKDAQATPSPKTPDSTSAQKKT